MAMYTGGYKIKNLDKIILKIKGKKEFRHLDNEFLERVLNCVGKNKDINLVLKDTTNILHEVYGIFNIDVKSRKILLSRLNKHLKKVNKIDDKAVMIHKNILTTHRSTKERLKHYDEIYRRIFKFKADSILDLAAGLNPFSYPWMNLNEINYFAVELTKKDCLFIQKYFDIMKEFGLNGKCIEMDLLDIKKLPAVDVCFIFKTLDSLETIKRNISRDILNKINAKLIVVSFPTKTLRGKKLSKKRLVWFKKLIKNYEVFETDNEIFYLIKGK